MSSASIDPYFGITPMLASSGPLPEGDDWVYEIKWDGWRVLVSLTEDGVTILTRNGIDMTARFAAIAEQVESAGIAESALPLVLDGEVVAFNAEGRPDFGALQRIASDPNPVAPAHLVVFDLPVLAGRKAIELSYDDRRTLLEKLDFPGEQISIAQTFDDGAALLERMIDSGMEGVVAKRRDSTYYSGKRTKSWVKVKTKPRQEFVVGGWTVGTGMRERTFGALLLGAHVGEGGPLRYMGNVGSGFSDSELEAISAQLRELEQAESPFDGPVEPPDANFVKDVLVVEVEFQDLTLDEKLRHPVFKGLRADKPANQVFLERSDEEL
ncbi:MAG: non-homologous end-joining DNA ligase [Solirubrobacterales bacterium]